MSFRILLSALASRRSSSARACCCSRFSLRYLAPLLPFCLFVRRASVSFTCLATSSSETSTFTSLALRLRSFAARFEPCCWFWLLRFWLFPALGWLLLLPPSLRRLPWLFFPALGWLAALFTSTRSLPMRARFLRCPLCPAAALVVPAAALFVCAPALRSRRRSSLVFFLGLVVALIALRSMVPSTFGPVISVCVCSLNTPSSSSPMAFALSSTLGLAGLAGFSRSGLGCAVCCAGCFGSSTCAAGASGFVCATCSGSLGSFGCAFGSAGFGFSGWVSAGFSVVLGLFCASSSMRPSSFTLGRISSGTTVSTISGSGLLPFFCAGRFFSCRLCIISSALFRRSLSAPNSCRSISYSSSLSFWFGSPVTATPFLLRKSVSVCSPTPNSLIALFSLIFMRVDKFFY